MISEPPLETVDQKMCRQAFNDKEKAMVIEGRIADRAMCKNVKGTLIPWSIFNGSNSLVTEIENNHVAPSGKSKFFLI